MCHLGQVIISIFSNILWIPLTYTVIKLVKKVSSFEKEMYEKLISEALSEELNKTVI